ncbi:malto-oligosyltrehalose trehalohydrolase [Candidatus Nitrosoglobus terrae]|uniref:Malto-oligosyltrehalose trehalohydrolase n=1 Tax=Candidatus Nitrosoglobus terrae TaxID=1630141 RepID=A0A1Q2SMS8_9GAMM|nr:malto-oligosyltrehalose trehalohydrolase [Candidatus Nitrosoglobus terrae]BAW80430.1 malto-oligosyltrehalose trehalohydrolase [Candidatus Nitrosoglobus terrae]
MIRHYYHQMPFGAEITSKDTGYFRLWAPAAKEVKLCLEKESKKTYLEMTSRGDGWFELETCQATTGSLYRYQIDNKIEIPDPASRFQPQDIHGPSEIINPANFEWQDLKWTGRPWEEAIIYEIHVGAFTPEGNFQGVENRLDYLAKLGVTALELMPVADFPGRWNWGYDGVYLFSPDSRYGKPEDLKRLVQSAHARGLMVFLDVVYNHFGPEGNYLSQYAPDFFTENYHTPWGLAVNFDGKNSYWVRQFFIQNALFWLQEYQFDGLRLDAVHAIYDNSELNILKEIAEATHHLFSDHRQIHLILENDNNESRYLTRRCNKRPYWYTAQWNDDIHHSLHVLSTKETVGYYSDYANQPLIHLGRCLSQGFDFQGQQSSYRDHQPRGETSIDLPPSAFISFLQNHDQIGNRAFGDRINTLTTPEVVRVLTALILLSPFPPMLFMGQEWGSTQPFLFFCDFSEDLAQSVKEGRRQEFARFLAFNDPTSLEQIPDPTDQATFENSVLSWEQAISSNGQEWTKLYQQLLKLRRQIIVPRLAKITSTQGNCIFLSTEALRVCWQLGDGSKFILLANFGDVPARLPDAISKQVLFSTPENLGQALAHGILPNWALACFFEEAALEEVTH